MSNIYSAVIQVNILQLLTQLLTFFVITHLDMPVVTHLDRIIVTHLDMLVVTHLNKLVVTHLDILIVTHLRDILRLITKTYLELHTCKFAAYSPANWRLWGDLVCQISSRPALPVRT